MSKKLLTNKGNRETTSLNGYLNYLADLSEKDYLNFNTQVFEQKKTGLNSSLLQYLQFKNHIGTG